MPACMHAAACLPCRCGASRFLHAAAQAEPLLAATPSREPELGQTCWGVVAQPAPNPARRSFMPPPARLQLRCYEECGHHSRLTPAPCFPHCRQDCRGAAAGGGSASTCTNVHDLRLVSEDDMFKAAGTLKARATPVVATGGSSLRGTVPASNNVGVDGAAHADCNCVGRLRCSAMAHAHLLACSPSHPIHMCMCCSAWVNMSPSWRRGTQQRVATPPLKLAVPCGQASYA